MPLILVPVVLISLTTIPLGKAVGQEPKPRNPRYAQEYVHSFKAGADNRAAFVLMGPSAADCVKYEAAGMRIILPAGFKGTRPSTGVTSNFGVKGDFEITLTYEILAEPAPQDAGGQTRFCVAVTLNKPDVIDQAALNRRVAGKGGTQYYPWLNIHGKDRGQPTPTQAKSGRLRLVRTGAELAFWAAAGDDDELKLLFTEPFGAEDIRGINVVGSTGSAAAALDVRFSELRIRAEAAPVKTAPPPASASKEANPPAREYAQKYAQSFQGQAKPERWDYTGPFADRCVHFERTGLRIALPTGWKNERGSTGLNLPATVQGNFEITATFELLDAPEPADAGHPATRISLGIYKNTQRANVATVSRIISSSSGDVFVAWQSLSSDVAGKSERFGNGTTDAKVGRLRLVRDGGDLYYCIAEGPGGEFHTLRKFAFGSEDLKDIRLIGSTGGEKALVDVRFTDLLIRADGLPDLAAPRDDAVPGGEVAQPAPPSRAWMAATAIIGGAVFVFLLAGSLVGVVLYRRRNPTPVPTIDHGKKSDAGPTTLAIACAACGKQLKCKIDAVGKKLKCPQCGKATLVAAPTAAG